MAYTEVYVDPSIAADSGTGTIGDPFGDLEYAIEQTTFDTTNGTRFNIKAGTAELTAADLYTATQDVVTTPAYLPGVGAPLIFQGYTAVAGDGGIGEIDAGGTHTVADMLGIDYTHFIDMKLGNCGANIIADLDAYSSFVRCEIYGSSISGYFLRTSSYSVMDSCYIHSITGNNGMYTITSRVENNYIDLTDAPTLSFGVVTSSGQCRNNIILVTGTGIGFRTTGGSWILNNSIYSNGGTGTGISDAGTYATVDNNLIEGFSGAGGDGIEMIAPSDQAIYRGNAVYNCTTSYTFRDVLENIDNEVLTASPFNDAANGDFSPANVGNVIEGALPVEIGGGLV